ncbi:MAG: peptide deformylase [Chlamydiia bacterium]|nr:peptide deformylase [Chlamydiia bacterium]
MVFGGEPPYIPVDHPMLREQAQDIPVEEICTPRIQGVIDEMLALTVDERKENRMVGLAAPQVGIPLKIICVDMHMTIERIDFSPPLEVFINPEITWYSEEMESFREGCFSTGSLAGIVPRAQKIRAAAYNREGERVELELEGYTARIFQHETDHLNGIRFPQRMTNFSHLHWIELDQIEEYRANYENWPHTCSQEEWLEYGGFST